MQTRPLPPTLLWKNVWQRIYISVRHYPFTIIIFFCLLYCFCFFDAFINDFFNYYYWNYKIISFY